LGEGRLRAILYSNIAICLTKEDDHKDAIEYCRKAIASVTIPSIRIHLT
jgi:hypothetical protein